MRKDRLAHFRKRLVEKQRQLTEEVGRTALYVKDQEDDSIKDLGDQANTAYTREFFFELGNGDRRLLRDVVSCPGADTCNLAVTQSRGLARAIGERLEEEGLAEVGGIRVNISGCMNSCGQHHTADIGRVYFAGESGNRERTHGVIQLRQVTRPVKIA